jgi:membrane protease YdiL (CAAX protease family)
MHDSPENLPRPRRTLVDLSFWVAHVGVVLGLALLPAKVGEGPFSAIALALFVLGLVSLFVYFFAIGDYAKKFGRSAIVWGGLSFVFSPIGAWASYAFSFSIAPKTARAKPAK